MNLIDRIESSLIDTGFSAFGWVHIPSIEFYQEVRSICEGNGCRNYGSSWACPPAVGTIEECKARMNQYDKMILFSYAFQLEDSFDYEGMLEGLKRFKEMTDQLHQSLNPFLTDFLLLSNEGCGRCTQCTYPNAPCRFPQLLYHSLEGYGLIVNELAKEAGIPYNNGPDTVTYFGALLFCNQTL